MVHGDPTEAADLSQQFPQFQIVATAGGAEEPPAAPRQDRRHGAALIEAGHKGMYVIVLGFFDDPKQPFRYQRVPLDARFADSPEMQAKLVAYQKELETMTLAGLGSPASPIPTATSPAPPRAPTATPRPGPCSRRRRTPTPPTRW